MVRETQQEFAAQWYGTRMSFFDPELNGLGLVVVAHQCGKQIKVPQFQPRV